MWIVQCSNMQTCWLNCNWNIFFKWHMLSFALCHGYTMRLVYRLNHQTYQLEGSVHAQFACKSHPRKFSWSVVVTHQGHFAAKSWAGSSVAGRYLKMSKCRDHPPRMLLLSGGDSQRFQVADAESSLVEVLQISNSDVGNSVKEGLISNSRFHYASLAKLLKLDFILFIKSPEQC